MGIVASQATCSLVDRPDSPRDAAALLWAVAPWVLWPVLSIVGAVIVIFAAARGRRVRAALFGATLVSCVLALWPPYPWSLAKAGVRLTLQVAPGDALRAARDEALADARKHLRLEGLPHGSPVPTGDASFALEGVDPSRAAEVRAFCASTLRGAWTVTEASAGRIEAQLTQAGADEAQERAMTETVRTIERRLNALGAASTSVERLPASAQIEIELREIADVQQAKRVILASGKLALQLVEAQAPTREALLEGQGGQVPQDQVVLAGPREEPGQDAYYLLQATPIITGRDLRNARAAVDQLNMPSINFTLNRLGAAKLGEFTSQHIGRRIAIVLDGQVVSAPTIQGRIDADGQITGQFTAAEANELARILRAGALPVGLSVQSEVELPAATIRGAILRSAAAAALALVGAGLILFLYYRTPVIVALGVLLSSVVLTLVAMVVLERTVTLPGVAILVQAIGVALDRALSKPSGA